MKAEQRFDCVKMKDEIQARVLKRRASMSPAESEADMRQTLLTSDAPVARFWRKLHRKSAKSGRARLARI